MSAFLPHCLIRSLGNRAVRRGALALALATALSAAGALAALRARATAAEARLSSAVERLDELTYGALADDHSRAAIAWGYAERLRLGIESPFRLVEAASRDPRLTEDERHTVALALLSHLTRGVSHAVEPAALDGVGPSVHGRPVAGERHLALIETVITAADDPRAAELGVRFAYTLAAAERLVDAVGPVLAAQVAALVADRELARREAIHVVRTRSDPIAEIRERRGDRALYVERPVLLAAAEALEESAVDVGAALLDSLRVMRATVAPLDTGARAGEARDSAGTPPPPQLAPHLYAAGAAMPPSSALAVTIQRYLPLIRSQAPQVNAKLLGKSHNSEMLAASLRASGLGRAERRSTGRLQLAAAVAMRSTSQERVWFPGDSVPTARAAAASLGIAGIAFDSDVPPAWRPYFVAVVADALADLRRVLPGFAFDALQIRFRVTPPADSALAMHDPRTRTLHLPVFTSAGTLTHELAHDLDRQSAQRQGHAGYRSDFVTRSTAPLTGPASRLAASLRALTEELSDLPSSRSRVERPAEIFATRVDWFVAQALADIGISSGFLSAVQDELLTGHVVHPERLRSAGRTQSLLTALQEMTTLPPPARVTPDPSVQSLLRWSLAGSVDSRIAAEIVRGERTIWLPARLTGEGECADAEPGRVRLVRMAAEARARGWLRQRAQWTSPGARPGWAQSALGHAPWAPALVEARVAELRDHVLMSLAASDQLPAGLSAHAGTLASRARCGG